jgi:hypothetical protein
MFGNLLGWCISVCILLAAGAWLKSVHEARRPTPPTAFTADLEVLASGKLPQLPPLPTRARDADSFSVDPVIEWALKHRERCERFLAHPDPDALKGLDLLELLIRWSAAPPEKGIFLQRPSDVVTYHEKPRLDALVLSGFCAIEAAGLLAERDRERALALAHAAVELGRRLCLERLSYAEYAAGLELLARSVPGYAKLVSDAGESELASRLLEWDRSRAESFQEQVIPVLRVVGSIDPGVVDRHAGDVVRIATTAPERMWRVEATLKLGRHRFTAPKVGDRIAARQTLEKLLSDPDPIVRQAAEQAKALTPEDLRLVQ